MEESRCRKFYQNISANPSKSCRISSKIVPTCSPNPPKMVPKASRTWRKTSCSHQSEAFTKITQIPPRDSVTFGVQLGPKFDENSNKNQCWKKYVLQTRFFMIWTSFWRCFLKIFWQKNSSNSESMKNRKTLQNTGHASKNGGSVSKKLIKNQLKIIKKHKTNLQPQFEIEFVMILLHIWRPNSTPNHSKSLDFPHQNLEAQKCKIPEAFTAREGWTWRHFWSLGGRGETTKQQN